MHGACVPACLTGLQAKTAEELELEALEAEFS